MWYVMIEERLVESLRMKWEDAKRTKLEYYIANVNLISIQSKNAY